MHALHQSELSGLKLLNRGKVRDIYEIDDQQMLFSCEDPNDEPTRQQINEDTPRPAHIVE